MQRIPEIDGLRAIAVLSVFGYHLFGSPAVARITHAGWIGVDLFFVISGYLITTILLDMRDAPDYFKTFYIRRTLRIFPAYYAFFGLCFICAALTRNYQFSHRLWLALGLYCTSLLVTKSWFITAASHLPIPVRAIGITWSLSIEELFYLLWAPAVRFLHAKLFTLLVIVLIFVAPAVRYLIHAPGQATEYAFLPARMDTLAFGALLAIFRAHRAFRPSGWIVLLSLFVSAVLLLSFNEPRTNKYFAIIGYSIVALSMTLVLAFILDRAAGDNPVCRLLRSQVLVGLGTISYMFYLVHLFVIFSFRSLLANSFGSHWLLNRALQLAGSFGVTILIASVSWNLIERPILDLKAKFPSV